MHGAATTIGGIKPGAHPFEIVAVASIDLHIEVSGGRLAALAFGSTLDGMCQRIGSVLAQGVVNFGQMVAVERVEFRIVGRGVLGPVPPTPIAALSGKDRFVSALPSQFPSGTRPGPGSSRGGTFVRFAGIAQ